MHSFVDLCLRCFSGPELYGVHHADVFYPYRQKPLERFSNAILTSIRFLYGVCVWTGPGWLTWSLFRGSLTTERILGYSIHATILATVYLIALIIRGINRLTNDQYVKFIDELRLATLEPSDESRAALAKYDGDFWAWPVNFAWDDALTRDDDTSARAGDQRQLSVFSRMKLILCCLVVKTVGIRMAYPGCTRPMNYLLHSTLLENRIKLLNQHSGQRSKLLAKDGNEIDTMFVDHRKSASMQGKYLVICCEGNGGFYEIGIMKTVVELQYSALGWNHPGFGGSSGKPWPSAEQNAIDIVMQFAIRRLGFAIDHIILFAWSIGGYAASYAAQKYPKIKALVLDATFDNITDLARRQFGFLPADIVELAVKHYLNLDTCQHLVNYAGPLLIIRRTLDEIVTMSPGLRFGNKSNDLLLAVLRWRFPLLCDQKSVSELRRALASDNSWGELHRHYRVEEALCEALLASYVQHTRTSRRAQSSQDLLIEARPYPSSFGEELVDHQRCCLLLYVASKMMIDFQATHCTPLPAALFQLPWSDPHIDSFFTRPGSPGRPLPPQQRWLDDPSVIDRGDDESDSRKRGDSLTGPELPADNGWEQIFVSSSPSESSL